MATMELDDELCLCFHVTKRKVVNYLRVERPGSPSQLSECFGAGTGCGWCRPYLRQLFEASRRGAGDPLPELPPTGQYAEARAEYVRQGKGTPPPSGE
jgi:NAD(P)H-nitrite reductase large subunit